VTMIVWAAAGTMWLTARGEKIARDAMRDAVRANGVTVTDDMLNMQIKWSRIMVVAGTPVMMPIWFLILAGVYWVVFSALMGSGLGFRQHLAIVTHAYLIAAVGAVVLVGLMLARGDMRSSLSLAALLPARIPMSSPVYQALHAFEFFTLWWMSAASVMIARAGRLSPWKPMTTLFGIYFAFAALGVAITLMMGKLAGKTG
jgi:hypothetical protein